MHHDASLFAMVGYHSKCFLATPTQPCMSFSVASSSFSLILAWSSAAISISASTALALRPDPVAWMDFFIMNICDEG